MSISSFGAAGVKPGVVTSTTRPATPYLGMVIFETDTGYLRVWDGSAWDYLSQSQGTTTNLPISDIGTTGQTWTPTIAQGVALTKTVGVARYQRINKTVFAWWMMTITSTGTAAAPFTISLPVTANNADVVHGSGFFYDSNVATAYAGNFYNLSTTSAYFIGDWAGAGVFGTSPAVVLTNNDIIRGFFCYEAA